MSYRPGIAASIPGRTLDMNYRTLVLMIAMIITATLGLCEPLFARGGGGGNIQNSPGYQRRLQESRQQLSQPVQPSRHKGRHRRRH
jgi:hypothetical protein